MPQQEYVDVVIRGRIPVREDQTNKHTAGNVIACDLQNGDISALVLLGWMMWDTDDKTGFVVEINGKEI